MIANAAHAVAGMAHGGRRRPARGDRPAIGMTMFGVTTPCVTEVRRLLERDYDCLVFHATGTGGQSMEKLADSGFLRGVIDVTTTEVADSWSAASSPAARTGSARSPAPACPMSGRSARSTW